MGHRAEYHLTEIFQRRRHTYEAEVNLYLDLGERCKLSQWGLGRKSNVVHFSVNM